MFWITRFFSSSIGKKLIMALTGLFLCTFLIVHVLGNAQLFYHDQGLAFNTYATLLSGNPLIEVVSIGLYFFILLHAADGLYLAYKNRQARGAVGYRQFRNSSTWQSRNMAVLGTMLLVFITVHMSNFWFQYRFGYVPYKKYVENIQTGQLVATEALPPTFALERKIAEQLDETAGTKTTIVRDLYKEVDFAFQNPFIVLLYVVGMVALSYHLVHGFQSAFQTLGWNHPKYNPLVRGLGLWFFAIIIPAAFAAMPIYFYVKTLGN